MPLFTIDVEARIAQAVDALNALTNKVEKNGKAMERAFDQVRGAARLFGVALGAGAFVAFIKNSIDAQDKLNDLSKSTGIAVESLGGLAFAAKQNGSDLDGVAKAVGKLNLNIAKAAAGNEEAAEGFKAMGLSVRDANGQIKTADALLLEVADKFQKYADGPNKAALGNALFGKSFAAIIPLLDEGGAKIKRLSDYWKEYSGVSGDSAAKADELNDQLAKLQLHLTGLGNAIANELSGPLLNAAEAMTKLNEQSGTVSTLARGFAELFKVVTVAGANVAYVFQKIGEEASGMAQQLNALAHFDFHKFKELGEEMRKRADEDRKAIDAFSERIMNPPKAEPTARAEQKKKTDAPGLPDKAAADKALTELKAILNQRLHAMSEWVTEESDLLKARNAANEGYYSEGLLGVERFFNLQLAAQDDALEKQRRAFAESEALLRDFIADPTVPQKDRIDAQTKLNDLLGKAAKLEADAGQAGTKAWFDQRKAVDVLADAVSELNAQVKENEGDTAGAAAIRRASQNRLLRLSLKENAPGNVAQLDLVEATQAAHDQLNDALVKSERRLTELGRAERQIQNELQNGSITTLDALAKTDAARKQAVLDLEREIPLLREKARLSGKPEDFEAVKEAEQRIKDLAAASNQVSNQMRGLFEDALIDPLIDVVNHAKTADEALKSFFNNVAQGLLRLAAQKVSEKIFGSLFSLGSTVFGGGTGAVAKQIGFSSAGGNIMTEHGPLQLERYARGGITHGPILSLAGEAGPEAIIPLPDGRSVPVSLKGFDRSQVTPAIPPTLAQTQRGPKGAQGGGGSAVVLQIHPDAMHMTLRDWFEGEMARQAATR